MKSTIIIIYKCDKFVSLHVWHNLVKTYSKILELVY